MKRVSQVGLESAETFLFFNKGVLNGFGRFFHVLLFRFFNYGFNRLVFAPKSTVEG